MSICTLLRLVIVKENDMEVSLSLFYPHFRRLDPVPDHTGMLQATGELRNASLFYRCINALVLCVYYA